MAYLTYDQIDQVPWSWHRIICRLARFTGRSFWKKLL